MSDGVLGNGLDAVGANLNALASDPSPLEIGIAFGLGSWIITATKENSRSRHDWFFPALRTSGHFSEKVPIAREGPLQGTRVGDLESLSFYTLHQNWYSCNTYVRYNIIVWFCRLHIFRGYS